MTLKVHTWEMIRNVNIKHLQRVKSAVSLREVRLVEAACVYNGKQGDSAEHKQQSCSQTLVLNSCLSKTGMFLSVHTMTDGWTSKYTAQVDTKHYLQVPVIFFCTTA